MRYSNPTKTQKKQLGQTIDRFKRDKTSKGKIAENPDILRYTQIYKASNPGRSFASSLNSPTSKNIRICRPSPTTNCNGNSILCTRQKILSQ